jgi:hypothetical protein
MWLGLHDPRAGARRAEAVPGPSAVGVVHEAAGQRDAVDWSEAGLGDALFDLASLTLGHEEHLGDVVAGYGTGVDLDVIRAWWSLRSLRNIRWLVEHGFDPFSPGCEVDVLRSRL